MRKLPVFEQRELGTCIVVWLICRDSQHFTMLLPVAMAPSS